METNPTAAGDRKHETRDANIRSLVLSGVALFALTAFGLAVSAGVFRFFARRQPLGPPASPFESVRPLPPPPRLQVTPAEDLEQYRAGQDRELDTYGWADRKAGRVRIPIERAMDLLLEKGLPVRTPGSQAGQIKPGEAVSTVPQGYVPK